MKKDIAKERVVLIRIEVGREVKITMAKERAVLITIVGRERVQ